VLSKEIKKIDNSISEFFAKVNRKGRTARRLHRAIDKSADYLKPKVNEWLDRMRNRIVHDLNRKFAKDKALDIATELTDWEWIKDDGKYILKPALLRILANGAEESFIIAGIEARFDILNPKAVIWAEKQGMDVMTSQWLKNVLHDFNTGLCLLRKK